MKKILILFLLAGIVGILLSRAGRDDNGTDEMQTAASSSANLKDRYLSAVRDLGPQSGQISGAADSETEAERGRPEDMREELPDGEVEKSCEGGFPVAAFEFVLSDIERRDSYGDLFLKGEQLKGEDLVGSRALLTEVYLGGSRELRDKARKLLDRINDNLIFDPGYTQGAKIHTVRSGETLSGIGREYGINWRLLTRINRISEHIRVNQRIKVLDAAPSILIEKSSFTLTLFLDNYYVKEYAVGLGRDDKTPTGVFSVDSMLIEADWYPPTGGLIRYGEEGHLIGTRWIGFENVPEASGYGMHGTNEPDSIGAMESDGCIRMLNEEVEELYDFIVPGTRVMVVD